MIHDASHPLRQRGAAHPASKYTNEHRALACHLHFHQHWPATKIARHLGCNRDTVRRWLADQPENGWDGIIKRLKVRKPV